MRTVGWEDVLCVNQHELCATCTRATCDLRRTMESLRDDHHRRYAITVETCQEHVPACRALGFDDRCDCGHPYRLHHGPRSCFALEDELPCTCLRFRPAAGITHDRLLQPAIAASEVLELLHAILRGAMHLTTTDGWNYCGNCQYFAGGWTLVVFVDCDELDYLDHVTAPDGREADFDDWTHGEQGLDGEPLAQLSDAERSGLEQLLLHCATSAVPTSPSSPQPRQVALQLEVWS